MVKEAVILAGGFGTRLKGVISDIPKPMAPVAGRPFLEYLLDHLKLSGISKVVIAAGYSHEVIIGHFGGSYRGIEILYSVEHEPLGTGGAILKALELIDGARCWILNGDTYFAVDIKDFEQTTALKSSGIIIALKSMMMFDRYGRVETVGDRIVAFHEKGYCKSGLINGGVYLIDKKWFAEIAPGKIFSFERDILEKYVAEGVLGCYVSDGYFIDIGIPGDYERAKSELPLIFGITK